MAEIVFDIPEPTSSVYEDLMDRMEKLEASILSLAEMIQKRATRSHTLLDEDCWCHPIPLAFLTLRSEKSVELLVHVDTDQEREIIRSLDAVMREEALPDAAPDHERGA